MLFLCCALPCEAEPLIQHFSLQFITRFGPIALYQKDSISLAISGIGKIPMAMACTTLYHSFPMNFPIWLNIGCAGHADLTLHSAYLIHKITDSSRKTDFYPSFAFPLPCQTHSLTTVEIPETKYAQNTLYDMEGAGFYDAARHFSPLELIQCFKIISDNQYDRAVTKAKISESIGNSIPLIEKIIKSLFILQKEIDTSKDGYPSDLTFTEKMQWKDLIRKCKALNLPTPLEKNRSSFETLKHLVHTHVPTHLH